jgi:hypothetical protein
LVDSDAFVLLGASGLIKSAGDVFGLALADIRRLYPLPMMLEKGKLARKYPPDVREKVRSWCSVIEPLLEAPSDQTRQRLVGRMGIDDGEEILFGLVFENPGHLLLTGDKRALRTLCSAPELSDIAQSLRGRVACVESVLKALLDQLGVESLSQAVASMRPHNGMLNAVFSSGTATSTEHCLQGLSSYIEHLRSELVPKFLLDLT